MPLLKEHQVVRDTYEVERLLGDGAFAEVYRVRHRFLGRQALKVFKVPGLTAGDVEAMLGEALLLSQLGHPNITRVFEANTTPTSRGTCGFFTMEYVVGGSLDQWQAPGGQRLPVPTAVDLVRQVCSGLALAHRSNPPIIHRDIKPANILVAQEASGLRARLSDFGVAKRVSALTHMTGVHGTLMVKPPEALHGQGIDSCAGDIWAVGCTLYGLLTGELPYPPPRAADLLTRNRFDSLVAPSRMNHDVDRALDEIVARALAVKPEDRWRDAAELEARLARWLEKAPALRDVTMPGAAENALTGAGEARGSSPAEQARRKAAQAVQLARQYSGLSEAIRLLEEACALDPSLEPQYSDQLALWRKGIVG